MLNLVVSEAEEEVKCKCMMHEKVTVLIRSLICIQSGI